MVTIGEFLFQPIRDKYTEEIENKIMDPNVLLGDLVAVNPSNCVITSSFKKFFQKIQDFKVYPDDTWLTAFPKSGTNWTQEMVWLLVNNKDFKKAKLKTLRTRFPYMEWEILRPDLGSTLDLAANAPRPRCIKSHLPFELLPKGLWTVKPKIIYQTRNPRDVAISYYYHHRLWRSYSGTLEDFIEVFLSDRVVYGPFWNHVLGFRKLINEPNILFNTYEEMKKDLGAVIKKTANFLNIDINDDEVALLKKHLSFKNMKNNSSCNFEDLTHNSEKESAKGDEKLNFMRKGESGVWKTTFTNDLIDKFQKWEEKYLKESRNDTTPRD